MGRRAERRRRRGRVADALLRHPRGDPLPRRQPPAARIVLIVVLIDEVQEPLRGDREYVPLLELAVLLFGAEPGPSGRSVHRLVTPPSLIRVWLDERGLPAPGALPGRVELCVNPRPEMGRDDVFERPTSQGIGVCSVPSDLVPYQPACDLRADLRVKPRRVCADRIA